MMTGAAYLFRVQQLKTQGLVIAPSYETVVPNPRD
jgi:hypothetical protein